MTKIKPLILLPVLALFTSCSEQLPKPTEKNAADGRIVVHAVNYPLFYFAEKLAANNFELQYIVPPGEDPAFWNPSNQDIQIFQKADLIIRNGAGYAKWINTVSLPKRIMLDTSAGFHSSLIQEKGRSHQHGNNKSHQHGDMAFTTWLDFTLAEKQAQAIAARFVTLAPEQEGLIKANLRKLITDLQGYDKRMMIWARKWGDKPLLVSHPVYQYWAKRYGLNIQAVHWEPEMKWDDSRTKELDAIYGDHPAKWMIWEGTPDPGLIATLKERGIGSIVFSPCSNIPDNEDDWNSVMEKNIATLEAMLP